MVYNTWYMGVSKNKVSLLRGSCKKDYVEFRGKQGDLHFRNLPKSPRDPGTVTRYRCTEP